MIADDVHRRLIIGGTNIPKLRYPYYVSIDKNNGVIVSGALIAPDIVLTAGHVILDNMDNLTIKIGPWAPRNNESETAQEIAVQHYMLHPDWNMTTAGLFQNDFMVMKLGESDVRHTPVALNRNADIPMVNATVNMMGLGWTQPTTLSPATVVQEATLVCVSNDECESAEDSLRGSLYLGEIDDTMLCTVSPPNTTRDGCAWDSGDPIIIKGETLEQDLLVALGSSGVTCADPVFPATQARVSSGIPWITKMVCELSVDPPTDFQCNATTPTLNDQDESLSMLTMSDAAADMVGSLRGPATAVSTNSTSKQDYSFTIVVFLATAMVVGLVLGIRWRKKGNAIRRNFTSIGDTTNDDTMNKDDRDDDDDAACLHPTLYNSI